MEYTRISELTNVSSVQTTDLFEISKDIGSGNYESHKTTLNVIRKSLDSSRIITVDTNGSGDAATIKGGIALVSSLSPVPSQTNPVLITVKPGNYTEDNPLVIPAWTSVVGEGQQFCVGVNPINPNQPVFKCPNFRTLVKGFYIRSGGLAGITACLAEAPVVSFQDIIANGCSIAFHSKGIIANSTVVLNSAVLEFPGTSCTNAFYSSDGAILIVDVCLTNSATGSISITNGIIAEGSSKIYSYSTSLSECFYGVMSNDGSQITLNGCNIYDGMNGLTILTDDSSIVAIGTTIENMGDRSVFIQSPGGHIDFSGKYNGHQVSVVDGASFHCVSQDSGIMGTSLLGKVVANGSFDIGHPGVTADDNIKLDIGEGSAYIIDIFGNEIVEYWTYDASGPSGSRFNRLDNNEGTQLSDNGDALVVGSKYPFSALRLTITSACNVGSNSIVTEYWDGSSWTENSVCAYRRYDMLNRSVSIFRNAEIQYVEMNVSIYDDWVAADSIDNVIPSWDIGENMYAVRFRNNGALVSGMQFNDGRVKGSSFDVMSSKTLSVWGQFRNKSSNILSIFEMQPNNTYPPFNEVVNVSPNISRNIQGRLADNNVCSVTFNQEIPEWADISSGITLLVGMYAKTTDVGDVNLVIRYLPAGIGSMYDGSATEYSSSLVGTTPGIAYLVFAIENTFDISNFYPGRIFAVSIERDATGSNLIDTYPGDIVITGARMTWTRKTV